MKRTIQFLVLMLFSFTVFAACSSNSDNNQSPDDIIVDSNNNDEEDQTSDNKAGNEDEEADGNKDESENKPVKEGNTSAGDFKDQTDLKIGDTGQAESTLGKYEITIHSVKMVDELDGESPMFDHLFVTEITLKNVGNEPIDAGETIGAMEITEDLEGSGAGDYSSHFNSIKPLEGTIEPGATLKGQAVFDGRESNKYYIRTVSGLIASGAVKNQTIWTFDKSEAEQ